ncbi:hypothetical protein ACFYOK_02085 [Microbispora bryophytorum]|uniref:hypothetical protein n=1 Tax=Microbispora bryophytorum TaxID=1460882 RepID=UPI0033D1DAC1
MEPAPHSRFSRRSSLLPGQADAAAIPGVSAEWIQQVLWALTYTGWEAAEKGLLPRHGVAAAVTRAFESGMVVPPVGH